MDIVKELIKIANTLDEKGLQKEADELDSIIKEACTCSPMLNEAHPSTTTTSVGEVIETLEQQHSADLAVAEKNSTGKQGSLKGDIVVAEKEVPFPMYGPTQTQTRYCPDHPGVMVMVAGDRIVQCPLDGKKYDYAAGFKYQGGKVMPAASMAEQTPQDATYYQAPHPLFGKE